jgi:hypothetical protein
MKLSSFLERGLADAFCRLLGNPSFCSSPASTANTTEVAEKKQAQQKKYAKKTNIRRSVMSLG